MAASPQLTSRLEYYLKNVFRPDCDFVDGEILERNVGEHEHAFLQSLLATAINEHRREWGCTALTELRLQIASGRYRIPDVSLVRADAPFEKVLSRPQLACVEILSSGDRWSEITERFEDYRQMGVPILWAIDPLRARAWMQSNEQSEWKETLLLHVPGTPVQIDLGPIFSELADRKAQQ